MYSATLRYAAIVVAGMVCIVLGDTAGKTMTSQGMSPFFVAWGRFALAAALLAPFCALRRADLRAFTRPALILRAGLIVAGICLILTALRTEPIANVFGGFFVSPVIAYFGSALALRERISLARSALLLLGFCGVILVVKPGFGMTPGMVFAVGAGSCHGAYLVATRAVAGQWRPRLLLLSQLVIGGLVLTPPGLMAWPETLPPGFAWAFPLSAIGSAMGNYLVVIASRVLPGNIVAPLIYSQIVAAIIVGYLAFGDWPDALAFLGLAVIVGSGGLGLWFATRGR
ncbi:DMT family transporter [Pseudooceanicola sp. C21-150M6]|uniref:DMT family transporter n=1 Tax=Pseudooceanicola sp. C21-150M6 TaxID=3434355 RepID=UPI003D7F2040